MSDDICPLDGSKCEDLHERVGGLLLEAAHLRAALATAERERDEARREANADIVEAAGIVNDLRDRLALFRDHVCQGCGCAPVAPAYNVCEDCLQIHAPGWPPQHYEPTEERCAAGVSIGMRALAGRRILEE